MAIRSFKEKNVEELFFKGTIPRRVGWASIHKIAKRKLDMLDYAKSTKDLLSPPSNHFESLKGSLRNYYSIRINDQWRIIFKWDNEPYDVYIDDYH